MPQASRVWWFCCEKEMWWVTGVTKYLKPYVHSLEYWTFLCSRFEASVNGSVLSCLKFEASWTARVFLFSDFHHARSFLCCRFKASWNARVFSIGDLKLHGMPVFCRFEAPWMLESFADLNLLECLSFTVSSESWLLSVPELFCFRFVASYTSKLQQFKLTFGMMALTGSVDGIPSLSGQEEDW